MASLYKQAIPLLHQISLEAHLEETDEEAELIRPARAQIHRNLHAIWIKADIKVCSRTLRRRSGRNPSENRQ
jgi:hypothetical protein